MVTVVGLMFSYLYTDFLYLYFYKRVLGMKYSLKVTVLGTLCMWLSGCFGKILPQYIIGTQVTGVASMLLLLLNFIYTLVFYSSTIRKRIFFTIFYTIIQAVMDLLGMRIAGMLTGNYSLTMSNNSFIGVAIICSCMTITLGTFFIVWIWKVIEQRQWKYEKYQWMCIVLPISQYSILQSTAMRYSLNAEPLPLFVIVGFVLGVITDIYMFFLFDQLNSKNQAASELKRMKYQYELEQIRYEQLKAGQEETAKIRHDFQNYIMTLKRME